ncbi:efflux RND transporter periplasmic adaptor subunit [Pseudoalteromonas sp. JBTF-M23]|uniref:Efflux RND transporter periplasmic adaptor subunit n=1 Tax=Pseudoalteromonas caenipelagi TaxID=2726988 RepID=A0A849V927_9GAMM|nr:efflux RND transporter periplasmic adaptor subunit [Pseudoalteromonas caenipelagi]NOU50079.1 efflux RND transporter periplasmic adaptor subunit [Pseudoalteromonas caenipelagi]
MFKFTTAIVTAITMTFMFGPFNMANAAQSHKHGDEQTKHTDSNLHSDGQAVTLNLLQQQLANVRVVKLKPEFLQQTLYAPGELKQNGYTSYTVSPRTDSVIMTRHVALGEKVKKGDKLVTLFSESMAEAQADYMVAYSEWLRVKNMHQQTLSESERVITKTRYLASLGKLTALGLNDSAISKLTTRDDIKLGLYALYAQIDGVVLQDDFAQGQRVETGQTLLLLANEKNLWVEARLSANDSEHISAQSTATVKFQDQSYDAKVIQESHTIDPLTRTRTVRLAVNNNDDRLHAGMFVNVYFNLPTAQPVLAVPETALIRRDDGDWQVFITQDRNQFTAYEVKRGRRFGDLVEIQGLTPNTQVVAQGAFFIASEFAKSNFDIHNH